MRLAAAISLSTPLKALEAETETIQDPSPALNPPPQPCPPLHLTFTPTPSQALPGLKPQQANKPVPHKIPSQQTLVCARRPAITLVAARPRVVWTLLAVVFHRVIVETSACHGAHAHAFGICWVADAEAVGGWAAACCWS